jgi:hypothetical protein
MTIWQTVLVFVGIPVGVLALFAAVILGPSAARAPRYRPGSPWPYQPVWYLPHPEHTAPVSTLQAAGALEAGTRLALHGRVSEPAQASGGASSEW